MHSLKKILILISFLIPGILAFAQPDWKNIDKNAGSVPGNLKSAGEIAKHLTKNLTKDADKARAIYFWISHTIKYDVALAKLNKRYNSSDELVKEVLQKRQGVCQHYSELFLEMARAVGLKAYLIKGYTRQRDGKIAPLSHAWNAVRIGQDFFLIDATWASGYQTHKKFVREFRDDYFMIKPSDFIKTHMPFDPIWQFLDNPLSQADFINNDYQKLSQKGNFPFRKLIAEYEALRRFDQLRVSTDRIRNSGVKNKLIKTMVDENSNQMTLLLYNQAVDTLNYGVGRYNTYIQHKNNQFKNSDLSDEKIQELINSAGNAIDAADKILYPLISSRDELSRAIRKTRKQIPRLQSAVVQEKAFVKKYLSKPLLLRKMMFLK